MFPLVSLCLLSVVAAADPGPIYNGTERNLRVAVPRLEQTIRVDGQLSEPAWEDAARLTGFSQYSPDDGRAALNGTEVRVWYSPHAIHFGVRASATPGSIRATLADRDRFDGDDYVLIYLGTFNDKRQASIFGVNPLGVQMDGAVVEGSNRGGAFSGLQGGAAIDLSPDFVFESKGRVTDTGYEVELRIPFKSLRYQSTAVQDWGIHIVRRVESVGHEDSWVPALRSAASFLGQSGTLTGLTGLQRGLVMDVSPAVVARADGVDGADGWTYDGRRPDFGGNVRWGVTPNLTLNATVNPDFSHIEADATQFQIDPRQALFFAEKRPFFLDGIEFFSTPSNLVYSRRIVDPLAAVKLTGKVAGTSVAALTAVDDDDQSRDGESHPVFTIVRLQRDFGSASRAGVLYTNRLEDGDANHVLGFDSRLVWKKSYSLALQAARSLTSAPDDDLQGALWVADMRRSGRRFSFRYSLGGNNDDFRAAAGFIGRPDVVNAEITHQLALYGKSGSFVEKWTGDARVLGTWDHADFFDRRPGLERKLHLNNNFFLRGGWSTGFSVLVEEFAFDPDPYRNYALLDTDGTLRPFSGPTLPNLDYVFTLNTPRLHGVSASIFHIWGKDENFFEWSSANIVYSTLSLQWRPSERLRVDADYNLQSFRRRTDNSFAGIRRAPRLKLEYQASRAIFFRYVGELASNYQDTLRDDSRSELPIVFVNRDGTFTRAVGFRQRSFRNDWLFSYQPTPGTVLFVGYGNVLANEDGFRDRRLERTRDGFFVKLSYLFRL